MNVNQPQRDLEEDRVGGGGNTVETRAGAFGGGLKGGGSFSFVGRRR